MASRETALPTETLKVDVVEENVALLRSSGVVCIVGDVVELAFYLTRAKVVQRVAPIVNGTEDPVGIELPAARQLLREVPGFMTSALERIRFDFDAVEDAAPAPLGGRRCSALALWWALLLTYGTLTHTRRSDARADAFAIKIATPLVMIPPGRHRPPRCSLVCFQPAFAL